MGYIDGGDGGDGDGDGDDDDDGDDDGGDGDGGDGDDGDDDDDGGDGDGGDGDGAGAPHLTRAHARAWARPRAREAGGGRPGLSRSRVRIMRTARTFHLLLP